MPETEAHRQTTDEAALLITSLRGLPFVFRMIWIGEGCWSWRRHMACFSSLSVVHR